MHAHYILVSPLTPKECLYYISRLCVSKVGRDKVLEGIYFGSVAWLSCMMIREVQASDEVCVESYTKTDNVVKINTYGS